MRKGCGPSCVTRVRAQNCYRSFDMYIGEGCLAVHLPPLRRGVPARCMNICIQHINNHRTLPEGPFILPFISLRPPSRHRPAQPTEEATPSSPSAAENSSPGNAVYSTPPPLPSIPNDLDPSSPKNASPAHPPQAPTQE